MPTDTVQPVVRWEPIGSISQFEIFDKSPSSVRSNEIGQEEQGAVEDLMRRLTSNRRGSAASGKRLSLLSLNVDSDPEEFDSTEDSNSEVRTATPKWGGTTVNNDDNDDTDNDERDSEQHSQKVEVLVCESDQTKCDKSKDDENLVRNSTGSTAASRGSHKKKRKSLQRSATAAYLENFDKSILHDGAFLTYDSRTCSMSLIWSRENVEGSMAFLQPTLPVPSFKFSGAAKRQELGTRLLGARKAMTTAVAAFLKIAKQAQSSVYFLEPWFRSPPCKLYIFALTAEERIMLINPAKPLNLQSTTQLKALAVSTSARLYNGNTKLSKRLFIQLANQHSDAWAITLI